MIPEPLHPAIVHFPIVLIAFGCIAALVAAFWGRRPIPHISAVLLLLGASAAGVAYLTGDQEKELAGVLTEPVERLLDEHENWAKTTLICSIAAAAMALAAALLLRITRWCLWLRTLAAVLAVVTLVALIQTGHRGGNMVYRHGVGVQYTPSRSASP